MDIILVIILIIISFSFLSTKYKSYKENKRLTKQFEEYKKFEFVDENDNILDPTFIIINREDLLKYYESIKTTKLD